MTELLQQIPSKMPGMEGWVVEPKPGRRVTASLQQQTVSHVKAWLVLCPTCRDCSGIQLALIALDRNTEPAKPDPVMSAREPAWGDSRGPVTKLRTRKEVRGTMPWLRSSPGLSTRLILLLVGTLAKLANRSGRKKNHPNPDFTINM